MPIWRKPLEEEIQKKHLEHAIQVLHQAKQSECIEMLVACNIEISELVHEDKWGYLPLDFCDVTIIIPKDLRSSLANDRKRLQTEITKAFRSFLPNASINFVGLSFLDDFKAWADATHLWKEWGK